MRRAFTLIELLVVLVIMVLVMGVVIPRGVKMLESYNQSLLNLEFDQNLSILRANAFLEAKKVYVTHTNKEYEITKKGIIIETGNDNH